MAVKKLVKPNQVRGEIFDKLAECFGDSTLGMYDNKLRFEIINDDGEVIQFSLAPVVHKVIVDAEECDKLVPLAEQMKAYEDALAEKDKIAQEKKAKAAEGKKKDKKKEDKPADAAAPVVVDPVVPAELTADEQAKLKELDSILSGVPDSF